MSLKLMSQYQLIYFPPHNTLAYCRCSATTKDLNKGRHEIIPIIHTHTPFQVREDVWGVNGYTGNSLQAAIMRFIRQSGRRRERLQMYSTVSFTYEIRHAYHRMLQYTTSINTSEPSKKVDPSDFGNLARLGGTGTSRSIVHSTPDVSL
jgi:hypothetical protein